MKLVEYPYVVVRIGCGICSRKGRYRLARMAVAFGPEAELDAVLAALVRNCPWRDSPERTKRNEYHPHCHAEFIDLKPSGPPPDLPPRSQGLRVIDGGKGQGAAADRPARRKPPAAAE